MGLWIFGVPLGEAHWQPNPNGRGTYDILQTCIITLVLCVYSALHLNVPPIGQGKVGRMVKKLEWMLVALLAPEVILYMAWSQRQEASRLLDKLCERHGTEKLKPWYRRVIGAISCKGARSSVDSAPPLPKAEGDEAPRHGEKKRTYSMAHGFFLCMGGLAFDVSNDPLRVLPPGDDRLFLHPRFIKWILDDGHETVIPRLSEEEISDRSKADGLVKGIACVQAAWFCLQFITRLAQRLPVTLLELNTFAHALCALLVYLVWWEKPLDVAEPLCIRTEQDPRARELCGGVYLDRAKFHQARLAADTATPAGPRQKFSIEDFMVFSCKEVELWEDFFDLYDYSGRDGASSRPTMAVKMKRQIKRLIREVDARVSRWDMNGFRTPLSPPTDGSRPQLDELGLDGTNGDENLVFTSYDPPILYLKHGDKVPGLPFYVRAKSAEVDEATLLRLRSILKHADKAPGFRNLVDGVSNYAAILQVDKYPIELKFGISRSLPLNASQIAALIASGLVYGGLHMFAYGTTFHSQPEAVLWTVSVVVVFAFWPVYFGLFVAYEFGAWVLLRIISTTSSMRRQPRGWLALSFYGFLMMQVFFRLMILWEIFYALPYSDLAVFETPNWSLYFPHIG